MFSLLKKCLIRFNRFRIISRLDCLWRKKNKHNFTHIVSKCNINLISVGQYSYGDLNVRDFNNGTKLFIGSFCSIATDVVFLLGGNHSTENLSSYPFKNKLINGEAESISKGDIVIEDDVWIGDRSVILSGVRIGKGAVVAAGSVVTKDIEPYSIVGGVPARVIKYRFSKEIINELLTIGYSLLSKDFIKENLDFFYKKISDISKHELDRIILLINNNNKEKKY